MQGYPFLTFADNPAHQKNINSEIFSGNWQVAFDCLLRQPTDQIVRNFCPALRDEKE